MSKGGEHLKDEVRYMSDLIIRCVRSHMVSGFETASGSRWSSCRIIFSVSEGIQPTAFAPLTHMKGFA